jgi:Raf kinase inhibitor-like YbhB/YbcL family protein
MAKDTLMLEHVPAWLGGLLRNVRAGHAKLVIAHQDIAGPAVPIDLSSPAFANGDRLPERFTADGPGISPPLVWGQLPAATTTLALIIEDPDAPAMQPLVHAIVWDIPAGEYRLAEGAISQDGKSGSAESSGGTETGRNSFLSQGWLPPDPPTGHGSHDYVFQLFALREPLALGSKWGDDKPGRSAFVEAITGKVLGAGLLIGTYSRGEPSNLPLSDGFGAAVSA